ncbi:hypothetical protein N9Z08_00900 [Pirellulales bacterium]|nr:hypothetical protein [Pirellulales bacterium]
MNLARNTYNRTTARPPRDIRGCFEHLSRSHRGSHRALWAIALLLFTPAIAVCQMGQAPMQNDGLVNRAAQGIGNLNAGGAGRMYYGVNGADRGLGYRGSYMTLGGYFPALEDDYGGLWAADARGHFSNYAGFFSNIGLVRKQLLNGGSLLGFGVFWDYDGDQNQYSDQIIGDVDPMTFAGGYAYNQVGVSGELLTDWGNIRSNGYIPVGTTGQSTGKYVGQNILCMQGINAALGGADLELGAYLPSLADWAGMINVGGYTYGNTRYQLDNGANLVPWFGGVYTRLDMTLANNWDFSLQYNNDSYFDSTGFARLTYRLGGSRRRNVPDQMEQPMMRNEHIVRGRQKAEIATNPITGQPWRVIHVDNTTTSPAAGNGSITNPVAALGGNPPGTIPTAETVATNQYDVIFVHSSSIAYSNNPANPTDMFTFKQENQYLIGEGSPQTIPTLECGDLMVSTSVNSSLLPTLIPQASDTAIFIPAALTGETISGFNILASTGKGIYSTSDNGRNFINNVTITEGRIGIEIEGKASYDINGDVALNNQSGFGLLNNGIGETSLTNVSFTDISGSAIETSAGIIDADSITVSGSGADGIILRGVNNPRLELTSSSITNSTNSGIVTASNGSVDIASSQITGSGDAGIRSTLLATGTIVASQSTINGTLASGATPTSTGILMEGTTEVTIENTDISNTLTGVNVTGNAQFEMTGGGITKTIANGIQLNPILPTTALDGSAILTGVSIVQSGDNGIQTTGVNGLGGNLRVINSTIFDVDEAGISGSGIGATTAGTGGFILVQNSRITTAVDAGIEVVNSNLRVESSTLSDTGAIGINSQALTTGTSPFKSSTVFVNDTNISGAVTGIQAIAGDALSYNNGGATGEFNNLTARDNTIFATGSGIAIQGVMETNAAVPPGVTRQGVVRANIFANNLTSGDITLTTTGGIVGTGTPPTFPAVTGGLLDSRNQGQGIQIQTLNSTTLSSINNGATVTEDPAPVAGAESTTTTVDYRSTLIVPTPPQ